MENPHRPARTTCTLSVHKFYFTRGYEVHGRIMEKTFSIVICTYNGVSRLTPTLKHIAALDVPVNSAVELIVVNNASTDNTEEFVKQQWQDLGSPFVLMLVSEEQLGKGYAVEKGLDQAGNDIVLIVDDDNWLEKNYLQEALRFIHDHPEWSIIGGRSAGEFEEAPPLWIEDLYNHNAIGKQLPKTGRFPFQNNLIWGAGMLVKKTFWEKLRQSGFIFLTSKQAGKAIGEDTELAIAAALAGNERYYVDQLLFTHFMPKGRFAWNNSVKQFKGFGSTHIIFDAYRYVHECIKNDRQPSRFFWLFKSFQKLNNLGRFTLKQWLFFLFKMPVGEYYVLRQNMFLAELKATVSFYKTQKKIFTTLYNWQTVFFKNE
jgi:glycosyltransferase involved in cell wall biosynthesis